MVTIEIFNPIPGKGKNKAHAHNPKGLEDEEDYVELGLIVRDEQGEAVRDRLVTVAATDSAQNKTMDGTGAYRRVFRNGKRPHTPFYPFHYEFKSEGKHTVTFTCEGVSASVELQADKKKPKKEK